MNPADIIIDSSVAVKWYLPDEQDSKSLRIKSDFTDKTVLIAVPVLFFYEIGNILKTASKSLRIVQESSINAYHDLMELHFMIFSSKELFKEAFKTALTLDITAYDASYVILAEYLQIPFYTADEKLIKKAKGKLVKYLEEYPITNLR